MGKLWGKMIDTDGDGNLEVVQLSDDDPTTLFTPEACEFWFEIPEGTAQGSVKDSKTGKWYTGMEWFEKKAAEAAPPGPDEPAMTPLHEEGSVLELQIVNPGDHYNIPSVRNQFDIEDGMGLVAEVFYDAEHDNASSVVIHQAGMGYKVGQEFKIEEGMDTFSWDRKNPTYTIVRITKVHTETK